MSACFVIDVSQPSKVALSAAIEIATIGGYLPSQCKLESVYYLNVVDQRIGWWVREIVAESKCP